MADNREHLIQWLRDAHAMEEQAETMLSAQSNRIEHYPMLRARIDSHIEETKGQAQRLEDCLKALGSNTSGAKDMAGKVTAMSQGIAGAFAGDEIVKGAMAGYTFEHFEISAYKALIATAHSCGEARVAEICEQNLREEEAMADWLSQNLAGVTEQYLERESRGETAKR